MMEGRPNLKVELPFLVSVFLACQVTFYLLASLQAPQKTFFWDTLVRRCGKNKRTPEEFVWSMSFALM